MRRAKYTDTAMEGRLFAAGVIVFVLLFILLSRLYYLQVIKGNNFRDLSENNRLRSVKSLASRGEILDREGKLLVKNRPSFDVVIVEEDIVDLDSLLSTISNITGRTEDDLRKYTKDKSLKREHFEPQLVIQDATREEIAKLKANEYRLPGLLIEISPARIYPYKTLAAQTLGYISEISAPKLETLRKEGNKSYAIGDLVGASGLEEVFEEYLRGYNGRRLIEVDAHGKRRKEIGKQNSIQGKNIQLTIDADLQMVAEAALGNRVGAVVALDPNNGEVLAFVSTPTFDLNLFSRNISRQYLQTLMTDPKKPMINRAISGIYPTGSTIKLVETLAAISENLPVATGRVNCPGYFLFGRRYACMKKEGHGSFNLQQALMTSCNVFFYKLSLELGIERFHKYATALGLGAKTGISLKGEKPGLFGNPEYKQKYFKNDKKWHQYDTLPMAVGQGFLNATPLQVAQMTAVIVNGGKYFKPFLVKKIINELTGEEKIFEPELVRTLDWIPDSAFETTKAYASMVVNGPRGTARRVALPGIEVGGKTGTAQFKALKEGEKLTSENDDHAWFVGFAPVENPMIVVSALVEHGGHGGSAAGPIVKQVLETFFYKKGMLEKLSNPIVTTTLIEEEEDIGFVEIDEQGKYLQIESQIYGDDE